MLLYTIDWMKGVNDANDFKMKMMKKYACFKANKLDEKNE
jgi:hypothetical protein